MAARLGLSHPISLGLSRSLLVLGAVSVCGLAGAPAASAALRVTIEPVATKTETYQALRVEDISGGDDRVTVTVSSYYDGNSPSGFVDEMAITSPAGFVSPLPTGCYPPAAGNVIGNDDEPAFACENGTVDLVGLFTGAGNDRVYMSSYFRYPELGVKQIFSPRTPVFMNVFLGPGRDLFSEGDGTDAVYGGAGKDLIYGGLSNDLLVGGRGADILKGGYGNDVMVGGRGKDRCAGSGKDRVGSCERLKYEEG